MAGNSFLLKGWTITLVAALFALAQKESNPAFMYLAYFPAIVFWVLDGYYLHQERSYRALYNKVRLLSEESIDFSMDASSELRDQSTWRVVFSQTVLSFYGMIFGSILLVALITRKGGQ